MRGVAILVITGLALAGCARSQSPDVYSRDEVGSKVEIEEAVVVAARDVSIEGTRSNVGAGAGAVLGGVGGAVAGKNREIAILGAVAGAIVGAIVGSVAEEVVTSATGVEYMVRLRSGEVVAVVQPKGETELAPGANVLLVYGDQIRVVPAPVGVQTAPPPPPVERDDTFAPSDVDAPPAVRRTEA